MKRILIILIVALCITMVFAGCSSKKEEPSSVNKGDNQPSHSRCNDDDKQQNSFRRAKGFRDL